MPAQKNSIDLARVAALAAAEKLGEDIAVIDVADQLVITDCFVIVSADTERQVNAIVDEVEEKMREAGAKPLRREGVRESRWALLDYGEVVVHAMRTEERDFYGLDRLWADCPLIAIEGVDGYTRPAEWEGLATARAAQTQEELPLAEPTPDADEL
ncbi:ribosome silencing factor [Corynebacterium sp. 13CS0277]|uniref:ribosome silencing factor n=1 Tax=Corynebacterium sp. 13CS0277 TaxID=2071994 RepID=UPI000D029D72|nr:ribosome silencing factor [Corynebacterium sp. 13CS0277]PRQ11672.1 ribosome silencing factor [Corynebacterium sp. 13CS0277]